MLMAGDYNPIVSSGTVETATGILGRKRVRSTLPGFENGYAHILVDRDHQIIDLFGGLTAGEKYWFRGGVWSKVDMRDHELTFEHAYRPSSASWNFLIRMTARVRVTKPTHVVARGLSSVASYVEHDLDTAVDDALSSRARIQGKPRPDVTEEQTRIERALKGALPRGRERILGEPAWLVWAPVSISVSMDEVTKRRYEDLRADDHDAERAERRKRKERKLVKREIRIKKEWASYYKGQVGSPLDRAVLELAQTPTDENVARVVAGLNGESRAARERVISFVERQMEHGRLDTEEDAQEMRRIIEALEGEGSSPGGGISVGAADPIRVVEQRKHTPDEDVSTATAARADNDWGKPTSAEDRGDR